MEDFDQEKIPHSLSLEQSVLAGAMFDGTGYDEISDILGEDDFFSIRHRLIFRAIKTMHTNNQPVDAELVHEWLSLNGLDEKSGGTEYLGQILRDCPMTTCNLRVYATKIREFSIERKLLAVTEKIKDGILVKKGKSTLEILEAAEADIHAISCHKTTVGNAIPSHDAKAVFNDIFNRMDEALKRREGELSGIDTGIEAVNKFTDGLQKQDLIFIGARPSMGKTTLGMNFVEAALFAQDLPVVVFSMESPKHQIGQRLLSARARVVMSSIVSGRFNDGEFNRVNDAINEIKKRKIVICDKGGLSPSDMRAVLRKVEREHGGIGLIMADYVQKMKLKGDHKKNRNDELTEISGELKQIAMDYNCPFLCLAQLSKECERRPDKRPMMSDLRDCGGLEQDADTIIMLYRSDVYNPKKAEHKGVAELIFRKNRNGQTGTVLTIFEGATFRFRNVGYGDDTGEAA
jgi:replicative DNA helicase